MRIVFTKFALLPVKCKNCGKYVWLETYRHDRIREYSIIFGEVIRTEDYCKDCWDKRRADDE